MSEVHRYRVVKMFSEAGNLIRYEPHGPWVVPAEHYDTTLSQLAALREELSSVSRSFDELAEIVGFSEDRLTQSGDSPMDCAKQLQQRLADAERRNGEHISMLKHFANLADVRNVGTHAMDYVSALNPNPEAAANEPTCTCWLQPQEPQCTNCPNKSRGRKP